MAMIKCPFCNESISDKAVTCPHCGGKIQKQVVNGWTVVSEIPVATTQTENDCLQYKQSSSASTKDNMQREEEGRKKRPINFVKVLGSIITGVIIVIALGYYGVPGCEILYTSVANVYEFGTLHPFVDTVKYGHSNYYDISYDAAFDNLFSNGKWKSYEVNNGKWVVEFTGECTYYNKDATMEIQFMSDDNGFEGFYVYAIFVNGVAQDQITMLSIITEIFEDAIQDGVKTDSTVTNIQTENPSKPHTFITAYNQLREDSVGPAESYTLFDINQDGQEEMII